MDASRQRRGAPSYLLVVYGRAAARDRDLWPVGRVRVRPARPGRAADTRESTDDRDVGARRGHAALCWPILMVAIAATVAADLLWYAGGRRFGGRSSPAHVPDLTVAGFLHRTHAASLWPLGTALADPGEVHPRLCRSCDHARRRDPHQPAPLPGVRRDRCGALGRWGDRARRHLSRGRRVGPPRARASRPVRADRARAPRSRSSSPASGGSDIASWPRFAWHGSRRGS